MNKLGAKFGKFKFSVGEKILSHNRNLEIIDREYRQKIKTKNGSQFVANEKYYKYKCLNCGNEDWIIEHSVDEKQHCGCNACCIPAKKLVVGINDITITAPWMIKYFNGGSDEASQYMKYDKRKVEMVCPDCGRTHIKTPLQVYSNGSLTCPCGDGWSYPNKFMYSLLEQLGVNFEPEKVFDWSENRIYDDYINFNGLKIIVEQHGKQHYTREIIKGSRHRSTEEEKQNDIYKENLALENGIDLYFSIDSSESTMEHMKNSIIKSGLLDVLNASNIPEDVWLKCDEFSTSNFAKEICSFKNKNPNVTLHEIAKKYRISYVCVLRYIKAGNKFGWCNYNLGDDTKMLNEQGRTQRGQKPIYCTSNDTYYRDANIAANELSTSDKTFYPRQIRQAISRGQNYFGLKFVFVKQQEFNEIKMQSPTKVAGDFFYKGDTDG